MHQVKEVTESVYYCIDILRSLLIISSLIKCGLTQSLSTEQWTAVHQRICRHTSPVPLTCHPGRDWSTSTNQLAVPLFNLSTVGKRAFPVSGTTFWNSLPPHVTSAPSLAIIRQHLKTFLFHLSYPDLVNCGHCDNFCYLRHSKKSRWWWWWWCSSILHLGWLWVNKSHIFKDSFSCRFSKHGHSTIYNNNNNNTISACFIALLAFYILCNVVYP